ncbi:DUF4269 domain-containing protein [Psychrobacillus sp.]|uniref:DUF4269 domain-containing protein n=1 Tax=Psychrobacillus sp. TaxID=1871623 RepID=UPI0028BD9D93|nr:DUF4269 domain-containing protein [Psychrobacillus sp.]
MIVEISILKNNPSFKEEVIILKEQGVKIEPAFCTLFGLEGDPYEALLEYGKQNVFI